MTLASFKSGNRIDTLLEAFPQLSLDCDWRVSVPNTNPPPPRASGASRGQFHQRSTCSFAHSFLCLCFRFVLKRRKTAGAKAARRTLMKLNPGHPKSPLGRCRRYSLYPLSTLCLFTFSHFPTKNKIRAKTFLADAHCLLTRILISCVQSNLCTTTTLGTPNLWPLCCKDSIMMVVAVDRWSLFGSGH